MEGFNTSIPIIPISYTFANFTGSASSSSTHTKCDGVTTPWMDSRIWSRLPRSLVDRVVALLPPPAFFRARSVCKRWYGLLFSNSFLELYLQVSPRRHWFLFFNRKFLNKNYIYRNNNNNGDRANSEAYLFNPDDVSWNRIPFPLVPPGFSPASSSDGLVCWVSDEAGSKSLLLSNPLVGSLIPLPPTLRPRLFPSIGMTVTNTSVDLVVAGDDLISPFAVKNLTAESFHVDGGGFYSLWGTNSSLPRLCSLESGRMVYGGGRFYCMNYSPFSVLAYDVATNHWCKIQAPMRRFLRSPNLVESRGQMILIAAVEKSKLNVPKSLRLWGLQSCGTTWVEIDRMPQQLYVQFEDVEGGKGFNCVGHGEFIVITIRGSDKAVLFDFYRKRWLWVPPCPFACGGGGAGGSSSGDGGGGELHGFAYDPRLANPVTGLLDQLALPFQPFSG
ncbi:protein UNUSUAL FLORAL ORGANS [Rhododendron vialii]|uniref:protein UNUSUAL FLORAL ORGANS n=1 Tax=Rhododendron vialii TaxID=182163 RepID=UPI00265F5FD0|nr:protein UNUSUAL FLORAL ORGANS [Rhododendron vialii]